MMRNWDITASSWIHLNQQFEFNGLLIIHEIKPRLKHLYIRIDEAGRVIVRSSAMSRTKLLELIGKRESWIKKTLQDQSNRPRLILGEEIFFLGQMHQVSDDRFQNLKSAIFNLQTVDETRLQKQYYSFYRLQAEPYLTERVEYFSKQMGLRPSALRFRRMKRRWGSCNSQSVITFNTMLMQLAPEHIDYVVVHELAHLRHMNHSTTFHALVASYLKDEAKLRTSIKAFRLPNI